MGSDEISKHRMGKSPQEKAWKVMVEEGLLKTYLDMGGEVVEVMKGERELPDTERPIQDYLMLIGESFGRTEGID